MSPKAARPLHHYRHLVSLSILLLVLLGLFAIGRLPSDQPYARTAPDFRVQVSVPGVVPSVIEEIIVRPLEHVVSGIKGVQSVDSDTGPGRTIVNLHLERRRDLKAVSRDLAGQLELIRASWPAAVEPPVVSLVDDTSLVEEFLVTSRQRNMLEVRDWAEGEFAAKLREISGIAAVAVEGGVVHEILVVPDQRRLAGHGLDFGDVLKALGRNPASKTEILASPAAGPDRPETVLTGDVAAVAAVPVILPSGESIPLSEIARIQLSEEIKSSLLAPDGAQPVSVIITKQQDIAMSIVAERIQAHVDWMRANQLIPEGIDIHPVSGRTAELRQTIKKLTYALVSGVMLMLFAAYLILGNARRTVILVTIIVCTLQTVFVVMMLFDLALDAVILGSLTLGSGLFATAAMVMFQGKPPHEHDISYSAVLAVVVAIVMPASLVPLLFTNGAAAPLFLEEILVICTGWVVSSLWALLLVFTFDRHMSDRMNGSGDTAVSHAIVRLRQSHNRLLRRLLRFPVATLVLLVLFIVSVTAMIFLGRQDMAYIRKQTDKIVLRIQGPEFTQLSEIGDRVQNRLRQLPNTGEVNHSAAALIEMPVLRMDEERARDLGINIIEAGRALAIGVSGIYAGSFRDAEHRYDIRLRLNADKARRAPDLGRILLRGELDNRSAVYLQDVATIEPAAVPARLARYNGSPAVEVSVIPENDAAADQLLDQVREALKNIQPPSGYRLSYAVPEEIPLRHGDGLQGLGWALLGVFIATALLCRSLYIATLVTLSACFALGGAAAALLLFGLPASPAAWLAAQILIGITACYAVAPALYLQVLARRGIALRTRVTRSARQQFRPLLAMTLLGILGMLPLLWTNSESVNFQPIVIIIATGLVFSFIAASLVVFLLYFTIPGKAQNHQPSHL